MKNTLEDLQEAAAMLSDSLNLLYLSLEHDTGDVQLKKLLETIRKQHEDVQSFGATLMEGGEWNPNDEKNLSPEELGLDNIYN